MTPYRSPGDVLLRCAEAPRVACAFELERARRWRFASRVALAASALALAGVMGALAHASVARPGSPIELGPAAIAKLRRPYPGLANMAPEAHDPATLKRQAHQIGETFDVPVIDVSLGEPTTRRLELQRDELTAFELVPARGVVRVEHAKSSPIARAIGLSDGDEIERVNGFPVSMAELAFDARARAAVLEVMRDGRTMIYCVDWR